MKRHLPLFAFAALAAVFSFTPCEAATLVSVTGNDGTVIADSIYTFTASWTSTVGYTAVSISGVFGGFGSATAYLTTRVGEGTTVADQVTVPVNFNPSSPVGSTVPLFQNLDLPAGTYYLTIKNTDGIGTDWRTGPTVTTGENVTYHTGGYGYQPEPYGPATAYSPYTYNLAYTVTGTVAVPEPATTGLAFAGVALLALRRRR